MDEAALRAASELMLAARRERRLLPELLSANPAFDVDAAYQVARINFDALTQAGERSVGRKIGFTNRGIWEQYKVDQPIWAHMYASTVHRLAERDHAFPFATFCNPRIEPEIIIKFGRAPQVAEPKAIAACIEWVAHGFEIVDCHFPDWKFAVADTIADFALHRALFVGPPVSPERIPNIVETLSGFQIALSCDGAVVDRGRGSNVLDGPLQAIAHLMQVLAGQERFAPLAAGEIITTGTLTAAWPIAAGQCWHTTIDGVDLPGATLRFT
ncbi:MAG: fumarylacetoacetate hydrolase family protein [Betaproteobacteria bacterium]